MHPSDYLPRDHLFRFPAATASSRYSISRKPLAAPSLLLFRYGYGLNFPLFPPLVVVFLFRYVTVRFSAISSLAACRYTFPLRCCVVLPHLYLPSLHLSATSPSIHFTPLLTICLPSSPIHRCILSLHHYSFPLQQRRCYGCYCYTGNPALSRCSAASSFCISAVVSSLYTAAATPSRYTTAFPRYTAVYFRNTAVSF